MTREELERAVLIGRVKEGRARAVTDSQPEDEKSKLMKRVGPPTMGDEAVMKDVPALTPVGYAASEVPVAGSLVKSLIGKVSPKTEEELDLGKARYEQENPNTAAGLQMAAPLALPLGPAKLGAQALYQGAVGAADTVARGGSLGDAGASGTVTTGAAMAMGKVGKAAAPYLRKAGELVDSGSQKVAEYLRGKAAANATNSVLSGQTRLNRELSTTAKRKVGETMLDTGVIGRNPLGYSPAVLADRAQSAERSARADITNLIDGLSEKGVHPSKEQVVSKIQELQASRERTPDTKAWHTYLDDQLAYLGDVPDEKLSLRFLQNRKNDIPYDPMSEKMLSEGRKDYHRVLQDTQDDVVATTGQKGAYQGMRAKESSLIKAVEGSGERANRDSTNRAMSLTDYLSGVAGMASGGAIPGMAMGAANRFLRTRGSSMVAANLNNLSSGASGVGALSKMASTKFAPILEAAARRGKAAVTTTHHLLYTKNPEYRQIYDSQGGGEMPIVNESSIPQSHEGH